MTQLRNLFQPASPGQDGAFGAQRELFEPLLKGRSWRLERIVSQGQASGPDQWYDQEWDEWVALLSGTARLELQDPSETIEMGPGDTIFLAAHRRHRVEWTDSEEPCVWLAFHFDPAERLAGQDRD